MEIRVYQYKYYLNAMHSVNYDKEQAHNHTFTFAFFVEARKQDAFGKFDIVDRMLKEFFERYSGKHLNDIAPFDQVLATIENMGDYIYEELKILFYDIGYDLIQLEISETPVRIYTVSDRLLIGGRAIF